ncbi:unnamed protein product [Caenorhabditis angaria]|uniref:PAN-3 domain-containing protein n=1 Tax=Caenorhabditis angaria TaxID=860376 RepID=A0A9P1MWK1_9PELO|nr:unnamed protein product [Caenorhabditis angaria]
MLLFSAFFVIQTVLTAFVAIPGRSKSYKAEHAQTWSDNDEGCIGLCSRLPICQTNITTCSNSLASVYFSYSTNYSKTYKYTRTGNDWEVEDV